MQHSVELKEEKISLLSLLDEIKHGLSQKQKQLPCKLLYNREGSVLFDKICELEEYYPTRTENDIMEKYVGEMAEYIGEGTLLIEYGSGSSVKIRSLLNVLKNLVGYVPIDISKDHLEQSVNILKDIYPQIHIFPVWADYTKSFFLPKIDDVKKRVVYFPGSTIGNFHPQEAIEFLSKMSQVCKKNGGVLIGVDLKKQHSLLNAAYDDKQGITAEFNKNILNHLNYLFDADIDLNLFDHKAFFNQGKSRVEMHLVCMEDLSFNVDGKYISMEEGETIWTESSYKYTLDEFESLSRQAGLQVEKVWTDENSYFSVQYLSVIQ